MNISKLSVRNDFTLYLETAKALGDWEALCVGPDHNRQLRRVLLEIPFKDFLKQGARNGNAFSLNFLN